MNLIEYYSAPVFHSAKSSYTLRWQNELERQLMMIFDADKRIKDFFQPLMSIVVEDQGSEFLVDIAFWVEYGDEKADLVHIETKDDTFKEKHSRILELAATSVRNLGLDNLVIAQEIFPGNVKMEKLIQRPSAVEEI